MTGRSPLASRQRAAKPTLSREWIVAETLRVARDEGLEKATMRRVAHALQTGPASLYVYFANTAELHAAVTDELAGALPAQAEGPWRERLVALLSAYRDVLFEHPGLARSALMLRPMGPNTLRLVDRLLGLLLESGMPAERAAWGVDLLLQHVTATAAEHGAAGVDGGAGIVQAVREADPESTPHVAAHATELLSGTPDQRMSWAVEVILTGIEAVDTT